MYRKKNSIHRVGYYSWFQAFTRELGMYPLGIREDNYIWTILTPSSKAVADNKVEGECRVGSEGAS